MLVLYSEGWERKVWVWVYISEVHRLILLSPLDTTNLQFAPDPCPIIRPEFQFKLKQEHCMQYQCTYVRGPSFSLKYLVKKGHNSKNIAFRVMPFALQLHLVMISKYSKFGVDSFKIIWVMGYIKVFARRQRLWRHHNDHVITIVQLFLRDRQAKNISRKIVCMKIIDLFQVIWTILMRTRTVLSRLQTCIHDKLQVIGLYQILWSSFLCYAFGIAGNKFHKIWYMTNN